MLTLEEKLSDELFLVKNLRERRTSLKKKVLIGSAIVVSVALFLTLYSNLRSLTIIGHNPISSIIVERYEIDVSKTIRLIDTVAISDQARIAKLVKAIDKPKNQKLKEDIDMLVIYDRNYIVTINYKNGSNLKLAVTFLSASSQGGSIPDKIRIGDSFFDDSNVFLLSKGNVRLFTSIIN